MQHPDKLVTLLSSDRWQSIVAQCFDRSVTVPALDLEDVVIEAFRWPGSAVVVEITAKNLLEICRFATTHSGRLNRASLFAVGDPKLGDCRSLLTSAGFAGLSTSVHRAAKLPAVIAKHHQNIELAGQGIEARLALRLPWKPLDRYRGQEFLATQFSKRPNDPT